MSQVTKKVLAFFMAVAMIVTTANVTGVKSSDTEAVKVAKAAVNASGQTIVPYNAYIAFQIDGYWVSRDEWTSSGRGLTSTQIDGTAGSGYKYNYKTQYVSNNGTKTNENQHAINGGFVEPEIVDNGDQVMEMTNFDISQFEDAGGQGGCWNMLHISTTIPVEMTGVKCTNVKVYIDGSDTPLFSIKEAKNNQEAATKKGACYDFYIADIYKDNHKTTTAIATKTAAGAYVKKYQKFPTKSLKITYTLSGIDFSKAVQAITYTGGNVNDTFTSGDFKYKIVTRSMSDGSKGTVAVAGLSAAGKKKSSVKLPATVKASANANYTVKKLNAKAFANAKKLKTVTLNNSITAIPSKAFQKCVKLTSVKAASKVTKIGANAFEGCKKLKTMKLGSKVKSVGASAFAKCTSLKSINLGKVKSIGKSAFTKCTKLSKITIGNKVKVGKNAFKGCKKKIKVSGKKAYVKYTKKQIQKSGYKKIK